MRVLSNKDLVVVAGGFGPWGAAIGGVYGGATYLANSAITGQFNWGSSGTNVGVGTVMGGIGGPFNPVTSYWAGRIGIAGGLATGFFDRFSR